MSSDDVSGTSGFSCVWKVDNFSYLPSFYIFRSHVFSVGILHDTKWNLSMQECISANNSGKFLCWLERCDDDVPIDIDLLYEISVVASDGSLKRTYTSPESYRFQKNSSGIAIPLLESDNYEKGIMGLLNNDAIKIVFRMWGNKTEDSVTCFLRSRMVVEKRHVKWVIERFSSVERVENELKYSKEDPSAFTLTLYWSRDGQMMQIEITQKEPRKHQHVTCEISLMDAGGNVAASKKGEHTFWKYALNNSWLFPNFITKKWLLEKEDLYLPNDTLSLQFESSHVYYQNVDTIDKICFGENSDSKLVNPASKNDTGTPGMT